MLGESPVRPRAGFFEGVLISDFHAAYNHYTGLKQRCWVHLLRDIDVFQALYPADTGLAHWGDAVRRLYGKAKAVTAAEAPPALGYHRSVCPMQVELEEQMLALCHPFPNDDAVRDRPSSVDA